MSKSRTLEERMAGGDEIPPAAGPSAPKPVDPEDKRDPAAPLDRAPEEIGGRKGPDPTRFGDWEINGRCIDF